MSEPGYHDALGVLCQDAGADLHRVLAAACEPVPARDPVVYLADFACQVLVPLAAGAAEQEVAGTMAGRAFTTGRPVTSDQDGSVRVWVPVVEQTTRTGVLAVTVPQAGPRSWRRPSCSACSPAWSWPRPRGSATFRTCGGEAGPCRCPRACSGICCRR
jgi:hypothetical protein